MAAEGTDDLSNNGHLTNPSGLYDPEVAELPKSDVVGSEESGDGGDTSAPTASYTAEGEEEEEGELPADFERLWKLTSDNPLDFNSWTDLLQYCEQEGHMRACRQSLNAFLARYPLCYGYWKKFADLERRAGHNNKAEKVCEQGLKAIPLSVDLWIHYVNLLLGTLNMNLPESAQRIRCVFEEAVAAAGWDFHSDRLWDLYAEWEKEQGNLKAMTVVYDRVLRVPTQFYNMHYEKLKTHLTSHPPHDVLSPEEYRKVRAEYKQSQIQAKKERTDIAADEEERPPGEEEPADNGKDSEEAVQKMQELLLASREEVYQQNEAEVRKRWNFEDAIKRPYFHVKPLDRAQLKAWQSYLDWEMAEAETAEMDVERTSVEGQESSKKVCVAGHERVLILFERCLIACALYEEFWDKYVHYLEPRCLEEVRNVYRRACEIHLPYKHSIHLQWSSFEEKHGNILEAQRILESLEMTLPGLAAVRLRRISQQRRAGRLDVAESLLKEALEQSKDNPSLHAFYSIKLSRFLLKLCKNPARARTVLQEAIELSPDNSRLYQNLLDLEMSGDLRANGGGVQQCVAKALAAPLSPKTKILFSQRGLQYAEDFGTTVQSVLSMYDEHQKLLKEHDGKRGAENGDSDDPEKMSKMDDGSAMTVPPQTAPPTMPHVPITTPPPPMMGGDMSGSYGSYGSWYQQYGAYGSYQNPWNQYNQYNQYYPHS
ncbi:pre-mRNA-processing factor 39-like isoform X2 [Myxocyprinus asiaticus]|uniref:pre-mRNA-processing factor 39-like isoform X2 n=1 Tax=Myxocyprinus asiaticus TaxID=70543 RepID=UPI002222BC7B|nr:pre-mRNA-processing factor 39-like isoform X2 [Myxocyprinus asiaticus]